jgi:long-chain acyl-CoA synthetase
MVLPLSHIYGASMMLVANLKGWHSIVLRRFHAGEAVRAVDEHRIDALWLVPTMLVGMIETSERSQYGSTTLKYAGSGGAPLANEVRLEFEQVFGCRVYEGYGHSEGVGAATVFHPRDPVVAGAVGRPLDGIDLRIVDDQKQVLGAEETGEICIRGPNVMQGYWCDEDATRAAIVDDWFYTGDLGHVDNEGYVYVSGRTKDLIIKGGENISPREIEEALHRHPAVAQAAVIGLPHKLYGEDVAAVVILKSGEVVSPEALREHAALYVTKFKIPSYIQFREELPKTGSGKILKRRLRDEWIESVGGNEA